jgi:hypothetical protein
MCQYEDNVFVDKLAKLFQKNEGYARQPVNPIPYHSKFEFNILDDMRYFSQEYMRLLNYHDLEREQLNHLYRMTIWLRVPLSVAIDLQTDMKTVTFNRYSAYNNKIYFESDESEDKSMTLRLSDLTTEVELNSHAVKIGVNKKRIISFIKTFFSNRREAESVLPVSVYTDTFVTLTMNDLVLILNADWSGYKTASYYKYLNGVVQTLVQNDWQMEFILTGKVRS